MIRKPSQVECQRITLKISVTVSLTERRIAKGMLKTVDQKPDSAFGGSHLEWPITNNVSATEYGHADHQLY